MTLIVGSPSHRSREHCAAFAPKNHVLFASEKPLAALTCTHASFEESGAAKPPFPNAQERGDRHVQPGPRECCRSLPERLIRQGG